MSTTKSRFGIVDKTQLVESQIGIVGDQMSFEEIASVMKLRVGDVKKIYASAMRKLQGPLLARKLWEYNQ